MTCVGTSACLKWKPAEDQIRPFQSSLNYSRNRHPLFQPPDCASLETRYFLEKLSPLSSMLDRIDERAFVACAVLPVVAAALRRRRKTNRGGSVSRILADPHLWHLKNPVKLQDAARTLGRAGLRSLTFSQRASLTHGTVRRVCVRSPRICCVVQQVDR